MGSVGRQDQKVGQREGGSLAWRIGLSRKTLGCRDCNSAVAWDRAAGEKKVQKGRLSETSKEKHTYGEQRIRPQLPSSKKFMKT